MSEISRRSFLRDSALSMVSYALLESAFASHAFAKPVQKPMEAWLRNLHELRKDLKAHTITPLQWQEQMESLYRKIQLSELLNFINFERLKTGLELPHDRAGFRNVEFPEVEGLPRRPVGAKIFGMRKGKAIVPHGHNNLVSAHLIIAGSFHVRTFDRVFGKEVPNRSLIVTPSIDDHWEPGKLLTMSDDRDNLHWLVAESEGSFTFDVPISKIGFREHYPSRAQYSNMIYVDPTSGIRQDGTIKAKIMNPQDCLARFGSS